MERHRRSVRLRGFDYRSAGAYFVTICAYQREHIFREIKHGEMVLNEAGRIVAYEWVKTTDLRPYVDIDEFVVMPNHFHGILWVLDRSDGRGTARRGVLQYAPTRFRSPTVGIGAIVRGFKSAVTNRIHSMNPLFGGVWQRNYYERIIRTDAELQAVRQYIRDNPRNWGDDPERAVARSNPDC